MAFNEQWGLDDIFLLGVSVCMLCVAGYFVSIIIHAADSTPTEEACLLGCQLVYMNDYSGFLSVECRPHLVCECFAQRCVGLTCERPVSLGVITLVRNESWRSE